MKCKKKPVGKEFVGMVVFIFKSNNNNAITVQHFSAIAVRTYGVGNLWRIATADAAVSNHQLCEC